MFSRCCNCSTNSVLVSRSGATLVAPDILLSAAHCNSAENYEAWVGPGRASYVIIESKRHPEYNAVSMKNDFLLLKLGRTVLGITPTVINKDSNVPYDTQSITVVGYGATYEGGPMSSTFQEVVLNHVPYDECSENYGYLGVDVDEETMFCAGVDGGGVSRK